LNTNTSLIPTLFKCSYVLLAAGTVVGCCFSPRWFGTVNDDVFTYRKVEYVEIAPTLKEMKFLTGQKL